MLATDPRSPTLRLVDDHTLRVLEFEKVLALLASHAAFSLGREACLAVRPETAFWEVHELQSETAEMTRLHQMGIDIPFAGARDIRVRREIL